jgi:hypothetical protein
MQWYQIYFFFLKIVVLAQVVMLALGFEVAKSSCQGEISGGGIGGRRSP